MYKFDSKIRKICEQLNFAFAVYQFENQRSYTLLVSDGLCKLMGMERDEIIELFNNDMYRDTHPEDKAGVAEAAYRFAIGEDQVFDVVYRSKSIKCGMYVIVHSYGVHITTIDKQDLMVTLYLSEGLFDVSENKAALKLDEIINGRIDKETLIRGNYYDKLTGLPNMSYFLLLADANREVTAGKNNNLVMLYLDFSGMKFFNDKYGLVEGDKLICGLAEILRRHFSNENCGRLAQDRFAVYTDDRNIEDTLNKIFEEVKYINDGKTLPLRVGIYRNAFQSVLASSACDRAKIASDQGKGTAISCFYYYDEALHSQAKNRQYIIDNLDRAIEEGWIVPYYQQIVRAVNGMVCDQEALARWIDPVKGVIPPNEFIPVLENAHLIHKLDLCIVDRVIADMKKYQDMNIEIVPTSVNLSRYDFSFCNMVNEISNRVERAGIDKKLITIEITESVVGIDPEYLKLQVNRFHEEGFKVWMDDFGSGYSSLNMLQNFEFDLIKLDMRFMREFNKSRKNHVIIEELMNMANRLGIDTVAEGVETKEQAQFLREIGCGKLQGYLYSKPMSSSDMIDVYKAGLGHKVEDQEEKDYYAAINNVSFVEPNFDDQIGNAINAYIRQIPMGVCELIDGRYRLLRYNKSYVEFMLAIGMITQDELNNIVLEITREPDKEFDDAFRQSIKSKKWERIGISHERDYVIKESYVKVLSENPKTKAISGIIIILDLTSENIDRIN